MKRLVAFARLVKVKLLDFYFLKIPALFYDENCVIIIRIDAIGDYILFRNFLYEMRLSEKYKSKKIYLIGNIAWKDFAEKYDAGVIDKFIWFSTAIYKRKYRFLYLIRRLKAIEVINPIHSRTFIDDEIVKYSRAKIRIGSAGDTIRMNSTRKVQQDKIYTQLLPSLPVSVFEFLRNKYLFENFLGKGISMQKPKIEFKSEKKTCDFIVIFPGAQADFRRWPPLYFAELIDLLKQKYKYEFVICGGPSDRKIAEQIIASLKNGEGIRNLAGTTSLADLTEIIGQATMLISNETGAVHIAVAVNTPTVCISNGNHFGRFNPYPQNVFNKVHTIYPDDSFYDEKNYYDYNEKFKFKSEIDIKTITVNKVEQVVDRALTNSL